NFNQMARRLQEDQEEMRLLYSGLEEKVRERTLELELANRRLQELDELKSKFLSTVSHELLTPLTSIKGYSELLLDSPYRDQETQRRFLGTINAESDRLKRLISDLLDLTKIESGTVNWRMAYSDLGQIVSKSKELFAPHAIKKGIQLNVVEAQPPRVWVDADRVQQVVTNLVGNAIKFCSEKGKVEVRLARSSTSGPTHALCGDYVRVEVADNGPGIPVEERKRVFERFYRGASARRKDDSGTGLGLAISKEIVLH